MVPETPLSLPNSQPSAGNCSAFVTERPKRPNFPRAGSQKLEPQLATLLPLRGRSSIAPRTVLQLQGHPIFAHLRCVSGATGVHQITPRTAQGRYYSALTGWMHISSCIHAAFCPFPHKRCPESPLHSEAVRPATAFLP